MKKNILPIDAAAQIVGSKAKLAKELNVSRQAINNWRITKVPSDRCPSIERITKGKVLCEKLRPDVDWTVLRNSKHDKSTTTKNQKTNAMQALNI